MISAVAFIGICWLVFVVVWLISATKSKRTVRGGSLWWRGAIFRIVLFIVVIWLIQASDARAILNYNGAASNPIVDIIGVIFCAGGIALAIWARVYLGKNWGMPMTLKENPELVTSGPYRFVRHPIYSGVLLAMFGSALVIGTAWLAFFVILVIYFIYSAKTEERNMAKQFPDQYPEYKKRTKMLIPFIL